ncbi:MAG: phosphate/phosphite/phosphonate ABC transporter substrate-binding protein [Elainellaceae cyanobacterium]
MRNSLCLKPKSLAFLLIFGLILFPSLSACSDSNTDASLSSNNLKDAKDAVRVGVLVNDSFNATQRRYELLFAEISKAIGRPVVFVSLKFESQLDMIGSEKVDFVISNPLASVQMRRLHDTEFLATASRRETGHEFGGVIVVRPDSSIAAAADLRGKKGACLSMRTAAGGCLFQLYHLQQKGIDLSNPSDDISIEEIPSQTGVAQAVIDGDVDFGFIRTGQLEKMVNEGSLSSLDNLRVLEPIQDDYPLARTTQLYPTWAISALQDTPDELVEQMRQALLDIPEGHEALTRAGFDQLVPPVNYSEIDVLIESLNLASAGLE